MRVRYYDPAIGRFINEYPAKDVGNWFVYCRDNPVNGVDADGKRMWWVDTVYAFGMMHVSAACYFASMGALSAAMMAAEIACLSFAVASLGMNDIPFYGSAALFLGGLAMSGSGPNYIKGLIGPAVESLNASRSGAGSLASVAIGATFAYSMLLTGIIIGQNIENDWNAPLSL